MENHLTDATAWEELQISNDFIFGKIMQDPKLCKGLLQRMIDKGEPYKKLKPSYIIFICPFDQLGMGRHIYTFENICKEDKSVSLKDGTTKIFLNAKGTMDDVSPGLKAFLDYVAGKKPADPFVEELEEAVKNARKNREWRHEYMTLLMRDQENIEMGMEKGMEIGTARGMEIGILGMVSSLRDFNIPDDDILQKIQEKYSLSLEDAGRYIKMNV